MRKKQNWALLLLVSVFLSPAVVHSGEIYGVILQGSKPIEPGQQVTVTCGPQSYPGTTDMYGSFRIYVPPTGTCKLSTSASTNPVDISSFSQPQRYDFIVESGSLRRK